MKLGRAGFALAIIVACITAHAVGQRSVVVTSPNQTTKILVDLYGAGDHAIVLAHGGSFHKESWTKQAQALARAGFMAVALQFRGDTLNQDGTPGSLGTPVDNATDVLAAVAYCHQIGAKTVSAIGASLGGDAVADAEVRSMPGEIDRIVLLGSSGGDHPERLKSRKLFIVARNDRSASGLRLPGILESYAKAPQPKKMVVLKGSAHAQFLFDTKEGPSLMRQILRFMSEK